MLLVPSVLKLVHECSQQLYLQWPQTGNNLKFHHWELMKQILVWLNEILFSNKNYIHGDLFHILLGTDLYWNLHFHILLNIEGYHFLWFKQTLTIPLPRPPTPQRLFNFNWTIVRNVTIRRAQNPQGRVAFHKLHFSYLWNGYNNNLGLCKNYGR